MRVILLAALIVMALSLHAAQATVKPVSTDGEATVYLMGDFSGRFDVAYRAALSARPRNKSWSTLSLLLIGRRIPGPGASVGLMRDASHGNALRAFTDVVYPNRSGDGFKSLAARCNSGCILELRGDSARISAYVNGEQVASWPRTDLNLERPYIQLNAEVHGPGDAIAASLEPVRMAAAGHAIHDPKCAFTTRGIEPYGRHVLTFRGVNEKADGAFVNLTTGSHSDRC